MPPSPDHEGSAASVPFPLGVASGPAGVGFLARPVNALSAIDLASGTILWSAPLPFVPILLTTHGLVAYRSVPDFPHALEVGLIDPSRGAVLQRAVHEFPRWVCITGGHADGFLMRATAEPEVTLHWTAVDRRAPGPAQAATPPRRAQGTLSWTLPEGNLVSRDMPPPRAEPRPASAPYQRDGRWQDHAWNCGPEQVSLRETNAEGQTCLALQRAPRSQGETVTLLPLRPGTRPETTVTPDGAYLLVAPGGPGSDWEVFDVATGQRRLRAPRPEGSHSPCILGDRLYYVAPGSPGEWDILHALSLTTGEPLWSRPLGPTTRVPGQLPP